MGTLDGRAVLVTGASGGIGKASALEVAREGSDVGLQYLGNREAAESSAEEIRRLGRTAVTVQADIRDPAACRRLIAEALRGLRRLDAVVVVAGHPFRREEWFRPFTDLTPEDWRGPIEVDLLGSVYLCQAAIPVLAERGGGSIVLVASTPALTGDEVGITYLVAKAGVLGLTKSLAQACGPAKIRVNAVALGSIDTEAMAPLSEDERRALAEEPALKRLGRPEEAARVIAFLASDEASYVTGSTLVVDGGYALR